jgi:ssDNA-specific exonuclease RecJ
MSTTSETNTSQTFITKKDLKELQEHVKINAKKIVFMRKMLEDNRQWIRNLVGGYS